MRNSTLTRPSLDTTGLEELAANLPPTWNELVKKVREEAVAACVKCGRKKARDFVQMIGRAVRHGRREGYSDLYHLNDWELQQLHPVLEVIMPDGITDPAVGTAHHMVHTLFLQQDETALQHLKDGDVVENCAIGLDVHLG